MSESSMVAVSKAGICCAGQLRNQPAIVRGDRRINQLGADSLQRLESAAFICSDQP
jgi:hypothetical protein